MNPYPYAYDLRTAEEKLLDKKMELHAEHFWADLEARPDCPFCLAELEEKEKHKDG